MMPKLVAPTKRPIALRAVHPNAGIEVSYRCQLQRLIEEMTNSTVYWIRAAWRKTPPTVTMAQDASPTVALQRAMSKLGAHWTDRFDAVARELAEKFADKSIRHTDAAMMAALKEAGFTVSFRATAAIEEAFNAVVAENVALIRSIPQKYLSSVEGEVWRTVSGGYDLQSLTQTLQSKYGVATYERAALIARDQTNKAKAAIEARRRTDLGIMQAVWQHSGGGHEPRPSHLKAGRDRVIFDIDKGWYDPDAGEFILPGELINCRCTSRAIIPGFES